MGRKAKIKFYCYEFLVSVDGAGQHDGITPTDAELQGWFPYFIEYKEDVDGRLLFLYQPQCARVSALINNIEWMRQHPRPHFGEVFDRADLVDIRDRPEHTIKTLAHVTLLEALEGLVEVLKARDAALRAQR